MCSPLDSTTFKVVPSIPNPAIVSRVELRCLRLENFEPETFHIPYQHYSSQMRVLLRCFFDTGIPYLQNLSASLLDIRERVVIPEGENRRIASRNQSHLLSSNRIPRDDRFRRPRSSIAQHNVCDTDRASKMLAIDGRCKNIAPIISGQIVPSDCARINDVACDRLNNSVRNLSQGEECGAVPSASQSRPLISHLLPSPKLPAP